MQASEKTLEWLRRYYALVDAGDVEGSTAFFRDDAWIRIAHNPPLEGREAIAKALRSGLDAVRGVRHKVKSAWEEPDGSLTFEVDVTYTLKDGDVVTIPGSAFCLVDGERFKQQRLYADFTPVFGSRSGGRT